MASYMILSALSGKGPLSPEVTSTALTSLVCKPCQGGFEPPLLCALAVAQVRSFSVALNRKLFVAVPLHQVCMLLSPKSYKIFSFERLLLRSRGASIVTQE